MTSGLLAPRRNIHTSKGLLFQFMLSEFIASYPQVLTIQRLTQTDITDFDALKSSIVKLAGSTESCNRLFSWNLKSGILGRLKNYCADFSLAEKSNGKVLKMQAHLNQAFLSCIQGLDTICLLEKEKSDRNILTLHKILNKISNQMHRFSKLTAHLMQSFSADENVLFFLLRHKSDLDLAFGSQFVLKLIKKMYPSGMQEALNFLLSRYKKRNFDHLIPLIKKNFLELEKS